MYIIYAAHTVYRCSPLANPTSYHYISGCCISGCCIRTDDTRMYKCVISAAHIIDTGSANVLVGLRHSLVCLITRPRPSRPPCTVFATLMQSHIRRVDLHISFICYIYNRYVFDGFSLKNRASFGFPVCFANSFCILYRKVPLQVYVPVCGFIAQPVLHPSGICFCFVE